MLTLLSALEHHGQHKKSAYEVRVRWELESTPTHCIERSFGDYGVQPYGNAGDKSKYDTDK
jgi:hypothetical protein